MKCSECKVKLDPRKDVRYTAGEVVFCGLPCLYDWRIKGGHA